MSDKFLIEQLPGQLHGAIKTTSVTVGTTATKLPETALEDRKFLEIQNKSGGSIFIGDSGVTTTSGIEVASGEEWRLHLGRSELYAIKASGSGPVITFEVA